MRRWLPLLLAVGICAACPHDLRRPARDRSAADRAPVDLAVDRLRPDAAPLPDQGCPSPCVTTLAGVCPYPGYDDGPGAYARFNAPSELALDPTTGSLLVADSRNYRIRRISLPDGKVSTVAGSSKNQCVDGPLESAGFILPIGLAVAGPEDFLVSDSGCNAIRRIAGVVTTIAGNGYPGKVDGIGGAARFASPEGLLLESSTAVLVADWYNQLIRRLDLTTREVTTLAGSGDWRRDGPLLEAGFTSPCALLRGQGDTIFVAEQASIRTIAGGQVATYAGGDTIGTLNGPLLTARFGTPCGMGFPSSGGLLVAEYGNNQIRWIDTVNGTVSTHAGSPGGGYRDGPGDTARFDAPWGLVVDKTGTVYVADSGNHCIRMIR